MSRGELVVLSILQHLITEVILKSNSYNNTKTIKSNAQ